MRTKKVILIICCFVLAVTTNAQTTLFEWARKIGSTANDVGQSVAIDATGNVYTTGFFERTVDFDPGAGTANLGSSSNSIDVFVSKLDASGNYVWAKKMGGTNTDMGQAIAVDASGNVYTAGYFMGTSDFNPGAATYNLTASSPDIFISKLDAAGNFLWAKQIGGGSDDYVKALALDESGSVYITGYFQGTVDFDPGAGTFDLINTFGDDIFISKLDAAGNFVWAKQIGVDMSNEHGHSIAVSASGNVYTTGYFNGTVDFDPGAGTFNLTTPGYDNVFISKLDAAGNFVWAKSISGNSYMTGQAIAIDESGNIYTTGYFEGTVDFDPGAGVSNLTSAGSYGAFISKLDASGNFIWAKTLGGTLDEMPYSITTDVNGDVYTTGLFLGTADFNPGAATYNLISSGSWDVYISKLDASGNFVWAKRLGGTTDDESSSIKTDILGNVYTTGNFSGTVDFDQEASIYNLTSNGLRDAFIHKMSQVGFVVLPIELVNFEASSLDNKVELAWQTLSENSNDYFTVEKTADGIAYEEVVFVDGAGNSTMLNQYNAIDENPKEGTSYYRLKQTDIDGTSKYSKLIDVSFCANNKLDVFPNPSAGTFHIRLNNVSLKTVSVSISDVMGNKIYDQNVAIDENQKTVKIDCHSFLSKGIYFLSVQKNTKIMKSKIIVE